MPNLEKYLQVMLNNIISYAPKLVGAVVVLAIGFWVANKLGRVVVDRLKRSQLSPEITSFIGSMFGITLKIVVLLMAAGIAGFDTSALVGMLAAAGFAVGLALQGGLANFASGILILIFKPYKVSDWIDINGKFGKVEEIQIFNTLLTTPGLKTLIIPNGQVTSNIVTNFSKKGLLRLELKINIPYEESFPKVKTIVEKAIGQSIYIKKEREPLVGIEVFDAYYIQISVKPFVNPDEYWEAFYEINALLKKAFNENNIHVAYPDTVTMGKIGD
jgi:small conductance mechanosensitive channel